MKIIALDVSKDTLDILAGEAVVAANYVKLANSKKELQEYVLAKQFQPKDWIVALESTGDYHRVAALFFLQKGFTVKIINPILTKQFTNATIRKTKTDKIDAEKIMKLALAGEGQEITLEDLNNPTKELLRLSHFLTKLKTQLKLKTQSIQNKELADNETKTELLELIERMEEIVTNLDGKALENQNKQADLIDSIPGFSAKLSHVVVSECGDISRFKEAKALVAYAGLDPKITQSGHSLNHTGRITKRGSKFLRYALYLAARVAWRHDPELYRYYEKKRGEGRSFTEAMVMIARKLLHRIYAIVKSQRPYRICQVQST